jgi:Family of unknown function (DUF5319)
MSMGEFDPLDEDDEGQEEGDEDQEATRPLADDERESVEADLEDLDAMRTVFEPQGAKGVVIACTECGANHYYGWELLRESLEHMIDTGEPRVHEPAYQPKEDDYVIWDYGKGYVDALADTGLEAGSRVEVTSCGWCETPVEPHFSFCPKCGRPMAVLRLFKELLDRGMDERDVRAVLLRAGFEPFS